MMRKLLMIILSPRKGYPRALAMLAAGEILSNPEFEDELHATEVIDIFIYIRPRISAWASFGPYWILIWGPKQPMDMPRK